MFSFILNINQDFVWIKKLQFPMDTATRKQKRRNTRCSITQSALIEKEHIELLVMQLLILLCCIQKPFSNGFFSFLFSKLSSCYWFFFLFIPSFHSSFLLSFFFWFIGAHIILSVHFTLATYIQLQIIQSSNFIFVLLFQCTELTVCVCASVWLYFMVYRYSVCNRIHHYCYSVWRKNARLLAR